MALTSLFFALSMVGLTQSAQLPLVGMSKAGKKPSPHHVAPHPDASHLQTPQYSTVSFATRKKSKSSASRSASTHVAKNTTNATKTHGEGIAAAVGGATVGAHHYGPAGGVLGAMGGYKVGSYAAGLYESDDSERRANGAFTGMSGARAFENDGPAGKVLGALGGYALGSKAAEFIAEDEETGSMGAGFLGSAAGSLYGKYENGETGDLFGTNLGYLLGSSFERKVAAARESGEDTDAASVGSTYGSKLGYELYGPVGSTLGVLAGYSAGTWGKSAFDDPSDEVALGTQMGYAVGSNWGEGTNGKIAGMLGGAALGSVAKDFTAGGLSGAELGGALAGAELGKNFTYLNMPLLQGGVGGQVLGSMAGYALAKEYMKEFEKNKE